MLLRYSNIFHRGCIAGAQSSGMSTYQRSVFAVKYWNLSCSLVGNDIQRRKRWYRFSLPIEDTLGLCFCLAIRFLYAGDAVNWSFGDKFYPPPAYSCNYDLWLIKWCDHMSVCSIAWLGVLNFFFSAYVGN